jgi:acetyl-CoA carboxylase biotin carboxyl carrier protein
VSARRASDPRPPAATPTRELDALADDVLPALIARLRASGLAELEVRQAGWRVRLRRDLRAPRRAAGTASTATSDGPPPDAVSGLARSPAVGYFSPVPALRVGRMVQIGDALGSVDMLGIPVEVTAPTSGLVSAVLVEAGEAVEYGQTLAQIEALPELLEDETDETDERAGQAAEGEQAPLVLSDASLPMAAPGPDR